MSSAAKRTAAFYDMDGTLISTNVVHVYAYYALNARGVGERLGKTASLLANLPRYWVADKIDRKLFNESFYKNYAGFTEDRLEVLGEEMFDGIIRANIFSGARPLIERSKEQGHLQVIVTGGLDHITRPLAEHLGFDDFVANRLEFKEGVATGRLNKPFIAGANKARWIRQYAEEHDIDPAGSFGYADSGSDLPLLSVVGYPCAVNPDWRLRTTARAYDWPIIDLDR